MNTYTRNLSQEGSGREQQQSSRIKLAGFAAKISGLIVMIFIAVAIQTNLDNAEGTDLLLLGAKRRVCTTCLIAYLEGMNDAPVVLAIYDGIVLRVQLLQVFTESFKSFRLVALFQFLTNVVAYGGYIVDAIADRIDIHH